MTGVISIIVPIYKVESYLDECVTSIVNQTYRNIQIILVDDGSPDRCGKICDDWMLKDKRITVIHKENGGLSDARNAGLEKATGDYIAFVDSDDWIEPQMYELMLSVMEKENADLVACGIIDSYEDKEVIHSSAYCVGKAQTFLRMIYCDTIFPVASWNKLYRKRLFENIRFPKGKICEDAFTTYLLVDSANKIVQIPEALYHYRIREGSIMTTPFSLARMDEEEAWRQNYQYIRERYPEIAGIAYDFYLQKVNVLFHTIALHQYDQFCVQHDYLREILRSNLGYILLHSQLNWKYRIRYVLDVVRIK